MRASEAAPEAQTQGGRVRGTWRGTAAVFLGIPFAAPPVGDLRFLAPAPVTPWSGVRDALAYGPTPQRRVAVGVTTIPEPAIGGDEILSVNVFTPQLPPADASPEAGLPVLVWIHGGGYWAGSPASPWYDGAAFNRDGVVVVTVSYRLGFEGFGWIDGAPLNRGILDQVSALEWVRDNIRAFGGDPGRVTVGGQSAGAGSALALLSSPRAGGLFHGVIAQSPPMYGLSPTTAEDTGRRFAAALGIAPDLASWRTVSVDTILDAEPSAQHTSGDGILNPTMPLAALARAAHDPHADITGLPFVPVVDGTLVVDLLTALEAGRQAELPLLLGSTTHEFNFPAGDSLDDVAAALADAGLSPAAIDSFRSTVTPLGESFARGQLSSAVLFRVPVARCAAARAEHGAGSNTWLYDFAFRAPASGLAGHCVDLPFAWDLLDAEKVSVSVGENLPRALAADMHAEWVRFISTGTVSWLAVAEHGYGAERFDTVSVYDPEAYAVEAELAAL